MSDLSHQAPAHIIIADDGQQATMKNADLLAHGALDSRRHAGAVRFASDNARAGRGRRLASDIR
jgi:hypothetical protein